ncbi:MAG: hypothetical protein ACYCV7_15095 [Acidimicrobiales bacterium]
MVSNEIPTNPITVTNPGGRVGVDPGLVVAGAGIASYRFIVLGENVMENAW